MRFLMSLIGDEDFVREATPEQMEEIVAEMNRYNDELKQAGVYLQGDGLGPTASAKTLRYGEDGRAVVTDGPFAESKEQIAGFWILQCKDLDEAVSWAQKAPVKGGAIEVRWIAETAEENIEAYQGGQERVS